jgi:hypothetical protein
MSARKRVLREIRWSAKATMKLFAFALLASSVATAAFGMSFKVKKFDFRPMRGITYEVYATGESVKGDTEALTQALQSANVTDADILINLNSPGGSVVEALKLGRLIERLKARTSVGQEGGRPGQCLSACVWVFLGGAYRYLPLESKIGVHQFAFDTKSDVQAGVATAASQVIAAEIVEFIRENRANTDFFKFVTAASPNEISFVSADLLRDLRVVTDGIYDESWSFEFSQGASYLRIWQLSDNGENKLILTCPKGQLVGYEFLAKPEFLGGPYSAGIFVNGDLLAIPNQMMIQQPQVQGQYLTAMFGISAQMATQIVTARSIGAVMQPPNKDIFLGFQISTKAGQDKLLKIILGCNSAATSSPPIMSSSCNEKVYIDPRLAPQRLRIDRESVIVLMANPFAPEWEKRKMYEDYVNQNQPITMPYSGGTVLIDPHNPCVQQYVR